MKKSVALFITFAAGFILIVSTFVPPWKSWAGMAETGNSIGAIQIGGTAMPAQLPFFVAACDYTLIGEELFAASAYLSHDPKQLGSLKGQDIGKALAMIVIVVGVALATLGHTDGLNPESYGDWFSSFQNVFTTGAD